MAKRNSTKTATKEAMSASEPKVLALAGWNGVNFQNASPDSLPSDWFDGGEKDTQTNMKPKNLMIQNNVITTSDLSLETRPTQIPVWTLGEYEEFTGVAKLIGKHLYASIVKLNVVNGETKSYTEKLLCKKIDASPNPTYGADEVKGAKWSLTKNEYDSKNFHISDIQLVNHKGDRTLLVIDDVYGKEKTEVPDDDTEPYQWIPRPSSGDYSPLRYMTINDDGSYTTNKSLMLIKQVLDPSTALNDSFTVENGKPDKPVICTDKDTVVSTIVVTFCYTNSFGSTTYFKDPPTNNGNQTAIKLSKPLQKFDYDYFLKISGTVGSEHYVYNKKTEEYESGLPDGVNVYFTVNDNAYPVFAGHTKVKDDGSWALPYYGSFQNTGDWEIYNTTLPVQNTTGGCRCRYAKQIDGRIYFYGDRLFPERIYIGGNAGNELSYDIGLGGAYIDIEPGIGTEIKAVHKFKTASGASIVTALTTNVNTGLTQRFNIVENSVSVTDSISTKMYSSEQVANVVGTTSFHGSGVFWDGMYYIDRYGLRLTTQQMEYASQLMSRNVSEPIKPVFLDRLSSSIDNAYVLFIDGIIYLSLAMNDGVDDANNVIFCYDVETKSWYTYNIVDSNNQGVPILSLITIDYYTKSNLNNDHPIVDGSEGLGIVTEKAIYMIPTAGRDLGVFQTKYTEDISNDKKDQNPSFVDMINHPFIETSDVSFSIPPQGWCYLRQIEVNFDWFIGELDLIVEGYDIYGRAIKCTKHISQPKTVYNFQEWIMIGHKMRTWKVALKNSGNERASFRLINILNKLYTYSKKVGIQYGFDSFSTFRTQHGEQKNLHTSIDSYNNLARYLLP